MKKGKFDLTKFTFTLGILLILAGFIVLAFDATNQYIRDKASSEQINSYLSSMSYIGNPHAKEEQVEEYVERAFVPDPDVRGVLEIPSVNFRREFYDINSPKNTVEKNIAVMKESSMPDVKGGNMIIAAHSGYGYLAFFNGLMDVTIGQTAKIYYNGNIYTYTIYDIHNEDKTGAIHLTKEANKTILTLTTCNKNIKGQQLIVMAELTSVDAI